MKRKRTNKKLTFLAEPESERSFLLLLPELRSGLFVWIFTWTWICNTFGVRSSSEQSSDKRTKAEFRSEASSERSSSERSSLLSELRSDDASLPFVWTLFTWIFTWTSNTEGVTGSVQAFRFIWTEFKQKDKGSAFAPSASHALWLNGVRVKRQLTCLLQIRVKTPFKSKKGLRATFYKIQRGKQCARLRRSGKGSALELASASNSAQ